MLSPGVLVSVSVSGEVLGIQTKDDVLSSVVRELAGSYSLNVVSSSIQTGDILTNIVTGQWLHYQYTAQVIVSVPGDTYDTADDVANDVGSVFEDVTGTTPTAVQQTGTVAHPPALTPPATSTGALTGLVGEAHGLLFVIVGLIVLLVVAIAWGKNAPLRISA